ncbi:MAG: ABC transporter permease [Candidatus Acidiferrales bacterium]
MNRLRAWLMRFGGLFGKQLRDRELAEELESRLQMHIEENLRAGMAPQEARRQALIKLGGVEQTKETYRDRRGLPWLEMLLQDIRFGLRMMRKNPGFTAVAVLTLALGISATTAMFTVVNGVVLRSLRYPGADRIVAIDTRWADSGREIPRVTGSDLQDLRGATDSFAAFSYYDGGEMGVQVNGGADFGGVYQVDADFFRVFTVSPVVGRTFTAGDAGRSAVVSTGFAERNFGSESAALGRTVGVEGTEYEIVGVMPPMFQFPTEAQVWAASPPVPKNTNRTAYNYHVLARLKPGLAPEIVDTQLSSVANSLAAAFPNSNRNKSFVVEPLREQLAAPVRTSLLLLMAAVALVLLIACANVANLMVARATVRVRELAMRAVLGAGRGRLVRQVLLESILLAITACVLGIVLAMWIAKGLLILGGRFIPGPLLADIQFDWRVLAFALATAFLTSVFFGIAPAWQAVRLDLQTAIRGGGTGGVLGGGPSRLQNSLVVAQIALSLTLAVGGGLLFRTLLALRGSPLGYDTQGILVTYASAPARTMTEALQDGRAFDDLFARLRKVPGVVSVAGAMGLPTGEYGSNGYFAIEGKQSFSGDLRLLPYAGLRLASPGYFATMGIPILRGRDFSQSDLYDRPFVAIVSDSLARRNFPNEDPIGHRIMCGLDSPHWMTVVGVVGDVRQSSPAAQPGPELYMPLRQHPFMASDAEVVVRTPGDPKSLIPAVEDTIRKVNPEIAVRFTTMTELVGDSIGAQRFRAALASAFAALALLLALSGMYAVMSYVTAQRTAEFGLRAALGAQRGNIIRLALSGAIGMAAIGALIGILLSMVAGSLLSSMLFGVKSLDAATYALVVGIVVPVIVLAAAVPAWRASRTDPMVALRYE